jgi:uncharacterized protein (DUF1800 family)
MKRPIRLKQRKPMGLAFKTCLLFSLWGCAQFPLTTLTFAASSHNNDPRLPAAEWRAINRLSYGPTSELLAEMKSAGRPIDWAFQQLDAARKASLLPPRLPDDLASINDNLPAIFEGARKERELRAALPAGTMLNERLANEKRFNFQEQTDPLYYNRSQINKAVAWRLASCSNDVLEQPLLARMTEFWFNHFNVYQLKGTVRPFAGHYAINVARAHALGKFEDLLLASAKHPAMLYYLDQWLSVSPQPAREGQSARGLNENYSRELLELHTVGIQAGYTQDDVRELARILTGWTVSSRDASGFQFVMRQHESGNKSVMGQNIPSSMLNTGVKEGEQAIRFLANHPSTAQRISLRLAQYFVADEPPQSLVNEMSKTFLNTGGDLYQVMAVMLKNAAFWDPDNKLYRTPYDFACASLRTLNAGQDRGKWLQSFGYINATGQGIQNWQTPDGYPFNAKTWLTPEALTRRVDFALSMGRNAQERNDLFPYLSHNTLQAVIKRAPNQRMGFLLASPELVFK